MNHIRRRHFQYIKRLLTNLVSEQHTACWAQLAPLPRPMTVMGEQLAAKRGPTMGIEAVIPRRPLRKFAPDSLAYLARRVGKQ